MYTKPLLGFADSVAFSKETKQLTRTTEYTFKINDFTPETMPFGRLVEYYNELKKMLGLADNIHLVGIYESSHGSVFSVDQRSDYGIQGRMNQLSEGTAPQGAIRARNTINAMLREDGTSGQFFDSNNRNVIKFPGKQPDGDVLYRVRDAAFFTGELYHIAGSKDTVKVRLSTDAYGTVFCKTTRDIGKALRDFLFENVSVSGRGLWTRTASGDWIINDFTITDFTPVKKDSLEKTIKRIRLLSINWPEDPLAAISEIENKDGPIH